MGPARALHLNRECQRQPVRWVHVDFLQFLPAVKMPLVLCLILEGLTMAESPVKTKPERLPKATDVTVS